MPRAGNKQSTTKKLGRNRDTKVARRLNAENMLQCDALEDHEISTPNERLARNLAMAAVATSHGHRSIDYVCKLYAHFELGRFWFELAELVEEAMSIKAPHKPPTIQ